MVRLSLDIPSISLVSSASGRCSTERRPTCLLAEFGIVKVADIIPPPPQRKQRYEVAFP
jgi:hypothetical protein